MIKVLHIVKRYRGNYPLLNHISSLDDQRFETQICYLQGEEDAQNKIGENGVGVYYFDFDGKLTAHRLGIAKQLAAYIDKVKPDCVVCHLEKAITFTSVAKNFAKCQPKYIGIIHGQVGNNKLSLKKKIKNLFAFGAFEKLISVSKSGVDDIIEQNWSLDFSKVGAIQNGIDISCLEKNLSSSDARALLPENLRDKFIFGTVGRLVDKKNHDTLIRAFAKVTVQFPHTALLIIGDGPLKSKLVELAASLGVSEKVFFAGQRGDVPKLLRALDVFSFPTWREGLPLSLLEAMASSVPPLVSDIPCHQEVVNSPDIGRLIAPNDFSGWVEAMSDMCQLPDSRLKSLGEASYRRIEDQFSHHRMIRDYEDLFLSLCD